MKHTVDEVGKKMDALGLWEVIAGCNFAVKPRGTVFPYFCTALKGEMPMLKVRFLMLEGWQTLHDFLRTRADRWFGVASTPIELPHYELVVLENGEFKVFRHDPGYLPHEMADREEEVVSKILWEAYGVMLRVEADRRLPLKFAADQAIFARVEDGKGKWTDEPLEIVQPRPYVEKIEIRKDDSKKAADLPFMKDEAVAVDFRLVPGLATRDPRPKCVYELVGVDCATKQRIFRSQATVAQGSGLKGMWESMPTMVLRHFVELGRVPGEIRCTSGRVFRFLRPLCLELPLKLSMHDNLPF